MQPVHLLSHCLECSWCFYKAPRVQCAALNVCRVVVVGRGIYRHSSISITYRRPRGFFLVAISIFDIPAFDFEWGSKHTQHLSLKPRKIWGFLLLIWISNYLIVFVLVFDRNKGGTVVWRESEEEKTCPQDSLLIFSDVLDFVLSQKREREKIQREEKIQNIELVL